MSKITELESSPKLLPDGFPYILEGIFNGLSNCLVNLSELFLVRLKKPKTLL